MFVARVPFLAILPACGGIGAVRPQRDSELAGMPLVVISELAPGTTPKEGLRAVTDAGNTLFAKAALEPGRRSTSAIGGGTKMSFPRYVHVTWRKDTVPGEYWTTGTVVGDYTVEVLSRLPDELFSQVKAGPGRAIVLHFRVADDGVQLAWAIQDGGKLGGGYEYRHQGGDF